MLASMCAAPQKTLTQTPAAFSAPRYFHLVWDEELDELRPALEAIRARRAEVLEHWHELYVCHFGDSRMLSEHDFLELFGGEIDATLQDLLQHNMEGFVTDIRKIGEELAARRVPFSELVVSMHLFEEAATHNFPPESEVRLYRVFDKLSHIRIIALAQSYFGSFSALAVTQLQELEQEALKLPPGKRTYFHGMVGASAAMRLLYERIEAAAETQSTVLVVGETGSGKELVARALHESGPDSKAPFVALNCAALPKDLIESELFGYKRGAFSGANADYQGLFRAAHGGTLFLDEITEMVPETQSKLLRAIQERIVRPVGSTREIAVKVRLIASTNRDPEEVMNKGLLRRDLYYRLSANVLTTPPLRERLEDVSLLVDHFIALFNQKLARVPPVQGIDPRALELLLHHPWPGNVRELAGAIESAFTFGRSPTITVEDLPATITGAKRSARTAAAAPLVSMAEAERDLIQRTLDSSKQNKTRAAQMLGISRKQLYAKIAKYGIRAD